jgi:hypothetical protein
MAQTPGPWRVKGSGRGLILRIFSGDHDDIDTEIATVFRSGSVAYDYEANARLIAAAPELLDACKRLLTFNEELAVDVGVSTHYPSADFARAAIAKAEGRS